MILTFDLIYFDIKYTLTFRLILTELFSLFGHNLNQHITFTFIIFIFVIDNI